MTFDPRWKLPQGKTPDQFYTWAEALVKELRKGAYLPGTPAAADISYDNTTSGLAADDVQDAIDEVEGRVDTLEALPRGELIALVEDQQTQNTAGGTFTSGADQTRVLNTLVYNRDSLVSLSSNQFTLPAGTWEIEWSAPAVDVDAHQSFLYNVTGTAEVKRGSSGTTPSSTYGTSGGVARVTVAGATAFEIRHRCTTTQATNGFGLQANFGTEVYTRVVIRRA